MATMKKMQYLVSKVDGIEGCEVIEGWAAVREMIEAGRRPKFRPFATAKAAERAGEDIVAIRATRDGEERFRLAHPSQDIEAGDSVREYLKRKRLEKAEERSIREEEKRVANSRGAEILRPNRKRGIARAESQGVACVAANGASQVTVYRRDTARGRAMAA